MYSICYVSAASSHMNKEQLLNLLTICQKNNKANNVTGLLLYNGHGTFIQVLEGDQEVIEKLYDKVRDDPRHHRVNCIGKKIIEKRSFPEWSMGFKLLEEEDLSAISGFSDFMASEDSATYLASHSSFAFSLLSHFKQSALSA